MITFYLECILYIEKFLIWIEVHYGCNIWYPSLIYLCWRNRRAVDSPHPPFAFLSPVLNANEMIQRKINLI